jgi:chromosome segregation ATPase
VSFGTAILGAVLGRKRISSTSANKIGTAMRSASSARKEAADVKRARETARKVKSDMQALSRELQKEVAALEASYNAQREELTEVVIRAKSTDIHVPLVGLAWMPYTEDASGRLSPAW